MTTVAQSPSPNNLLPHPGYGRAIERVAAGMTRRHPDMAPMIARAAELAAAGRVQLTNTVATVEGSHGQKYTLRPLACGRWACDCYSYTHGQYQTKRGPECKHTVALYIDLKVNGGF